MALKQLFNDFTKIVKKSPYENGLIVILTLYIILNIKTPNALADMIDSSIGNVIIVIIALSLFQTKNPILIVLGVVAAYELIRRSSISTGTYAMQHQIVNENNKEKAMKEFNTNNHDSLEHEMVDNIIPLTSPLVTPPTFEPTLTKLKGASDLSN
tara:strand:- start:591 stop:1055 length:465 start_codon:yes stop_codon:yes gene_type:complete